MTFPTINVKSSNIEISPGLSTLLDEKLQSLDKLLPTGETATNCEVEVEKLPEHQSGKIYRAEVNLAVRGKLYRAEATEESIEKAIDIIRDELRHELTKSNEKRESLFRMGRRKIKEMLQFGDS